MTLIFMSRKSDFELFIFGSFVVISYNSEEKKLLFTYFYIRGGNKLP